MKEESNMKILLAVFLVAIMVTGCDSGSNTPVAPTEPSNPPGTRTLSNSKTRPQHDRTKLMYHDASQN